MEDTVRYMGVEFGREVWTVVSFSVMSLAGRDQQSHSPREMHVHREEVWLLEDLVTQRSLVSLAKQLLRSRGTGVKLGRKTEICW